jgi:glycosyltransferase involved in cell wall biosynthesis
VAAIALHYGLPVVASGVRDVQEIIEDGVTGACVTPPGDPAALAAGIRRLFEQPKPLDAAFQPIRDRRSWSTFVRHMEPLLSATPAAEQ